MSFYDGGLAFPGYRAEWVGDEDDIGGQQLQQVQYGGMSMRDWFAGMALQGLVIDSGGRIVDDAGELAYHIADAMIAERRNREEKE